jgi:serine protease inhibitor
LAFGLLSKHVNKKGIIIIIIIIITTTTISAVAAEARSWRPPPLEFVADHPFLFIIWEKRLNTTLFMGRFCGSG